LCSIKTHCFGIIDLTNFDTLGRTDNLIVIDNFA